MRIKMTGIYVKEVDKAHLFYTTVLNFTEVMYTPEANLAIVASPEEPSGTTLLLEPIDTSFLITVYGPIVTSLSTLASGWTMAVGSIKNLVLDCC